MITASELNQLTSKSGKIIEGTLSYIRAKRWERKHGFSHPVSALYECNMLEEELSPIDPDAPIVFEPFKIKTVKVVY